MTVVDLSEKEMLFIEELAKYENKWVAILRDGDNETVVGSGDRIKDALREAESKGINDAVFMKVPSSRMVFIASANDERATLG